MAVGSEDWFAGVGDRVSSFAPFGFNSYFYKRGGNIMLLVYIIGGVLAVALLCFLFAPKDDEQEKDNHLDS